MSGHSKWSTIKHKKGLKDQKRGKIFSKLVRQIQIAAKDDSNPESNSFLRMIIEKAKAANMPNANIEKAIKKASGRGEGVNLEEITLEAYGPSGSAFLIEAITNNHNRTVSEIKHLVEQNGGHMAEKGSVAWLFEKKVIIIIDYSDWNEDLELILIDAGLEDSQRTDGRILLLTNPQSEKQIKQALEDNNVKIKSEELYWQAKNPISSSNENIKKIKRLNNLIDEHDDINAVYNNLT
jgi:YebC/PmpR family DNA-binding regulatory protein